MQRVLVFSPHPDDDIIGCGGSIAKHISKGKVVAVVYMTSGDIGSLIHTSPEIVSIREAEARKAALFLGISESHFFKNPDGYLTCTWENLVRITTLLREYRPNIVYLPHKRERHRDHRIAHDLVVEACSWSGSPRLPECGRQLWSVNTILCYEVGTPMEDYNYVEDISEFIEIKGEALRFHESQLDNINYEEAIRTLNRFRGISTARGTYCECFQVIKATKLF